MNLTLIGMKCRKFNEFMSMYPSVPLTYSWPKSLKCCPNFEQKGCTLISTRCHNYGWRFPLFTSFQIINHERSRGTLIQNQLLLFSPIYFQSQMNFTCHGSLIDSHLALPSSWLTWCLCLPLHNM